MLFIDVTTPNDHYIVEIRLEKIKKYVDLGVEIKGLWNMQIVDIPPIVIGYTGVVDNSFVRYLGKSQQRSMYLNYKNSAVKYVLYSWKIFVHGLI